ncbi:MAG: hypothetical protein JSU96_15500 [Acidobacteriota bacterium]|nr:MAG: hypothetical protein JSU96_15500 [Acidobacteriota bacterium]
MTRWVGPTVGLVWLFLAVPEGVLASLSDFRSDREEVSLDGTWEIVFDRENAGRENGWHRNEQYSRLEERREVTVPSAWERFEQDYEGVAYYRKTFEVPTGWSGRIVRLHFGAVNYRSEVWLNDEVVGFHEGGFTPFHFRVDELLKPGETNVLILRVLGPVVLTDQVIDGIGPMETPQWRGGLTGGIWQSVRLLATGSVYVQDVFIQPDIADSATLFQVQLNNTGAVRKSVQIGIRIEHAEDPSQAVSEIRTDWDLRPGANQQDWRLTVPNMRFWSPDDPHLYRVRVSVSLQGTEADRWSHRFGMRELTIRDRDFYLNGQPIYIKAAFFEGLYPTGVAYPDSEEMARREIQLAKEAGFNMIRPWRRPPAPAWLDLADEMGVMIVGSPAVECMDMPVSTPYLPSRVANEVRQAILRDRNRASIVQWELFNELRRPILKQMLREMALLAREMDPTRLILDESGGWAYGANLYLPFQSEPTRFNDIHTYPGPFINKRIYDGFLSIGLTDEQRWAKQLSGKAPGRNVVPGLMSFVSELGYGSLPDLVESNQTFETNGNPLLPAYRYHQRLAAEQKQVLKESGFENLYPDLRQFFLDQQLIHGAANKRMIEAVRSNPEVDGYCIHALTAGDWILGAGLLDLWRNPKSYAYEATKAANQPRILPIRVFPRNVYTRNGAVLEIAGVNDLESVPFELRVEIKAEDGQVVYTREINGDFSSSVTQLFKDELDTRDWQGAYTVTAIGRSDQGSLLAENQYGFNVFSEQELVAPEEKIAVLDFPEHLTPFLEKAGIEYEAFDASTPPSRPVFVTRLDPHNPKAESLSADLRRFVETGGTAVYIAGVGPVNGGEESQPGSVQGLPFEVEIHPARGLWTCIPHLVHDHPIFSGLPVAGMMRDLYENVWPTETLRNLPGEAIVASIQFVWFSPEHELHYSGPGKSWWGADLARVPFGEGQYLFSQLRILENLGVDPVADKLLYNFIRFVTD